MSRRRWTAPWLLGAGLVPAVLAAGHAGTPEPRLILREFRVEPAELRLGESFTVRARVEEQGAKLGSFLLRTALEVKKENVLPGLPLYASGKYYAAEEGRYSLKDNGKLDRDPRPGAFALEVSTRGWREGRHVLAFFASNRPAAGALVTDRRDFAVEVRGEAVAIREVSTGMEDPTLIRGFSAQPATARAGEPVRVALSWRGAAFRGVRVTNPYYVDRADTLPGFTYDEEKQKSYLGGAPPFVVEDNAALDRDPAPGALLLEMETRGWTAGVHHLQVDVLRGDDSVADTRNFAVKVPGPRDRFQVTLESVAYYQQGTHFGRFLKLRDGAILCGEQRSTDGGRTWQEGTGGFGAGGAHLADSRVLGMGYSSLPIEGREGWYAREHYLSEDGGRAFRKGQAEFHVPQSKPAQGHAFHPGPLFMRSILERGDGSLVALMAGWFKSDTALCPYGRGRPYSRSYVCESRDGGRTWEYLETIGYEHLGSEGYNEGSMVRLPNGEWLSALRTGNASDPKCHDNPILWSVSKDEGHTWSKPARTGVDGAYPSLAVMGDGTVVLSYGRPGAMLAFSSDNGRTWTDHFCVDATPYSGYTDVVEVAPGELLVGFGARKFFDPETGQRSDQLRLARVRVGQATAAP